MTPWLKRANRAAARAKAGRASGNPRRSARDPAALNHCDHRSPNLLPRQHHHQPQETPSNPPPRPTLPRFVHRPSRQRSAYLLKPSRNTALPTRGTTPSRTRVICRTSPTAPMDEPGKSAHALRVLVHAKRSVRSRSHAPPAPTAKVPAATPANSPWRQPRVRAPPPNPQEHVGTATGQGADGERQRDACRAARTLCSLTMRLNATTPPSRAPPAPTPPPAARNPEQSTPAAPHSPTSSIGRADNELRISSSLRGIQPSQRGDYPITHHLELFLELAHVPGRRRRQIR